MVVYVFGNKLVIITKPKMFHLDLNKRVHKSLKHETEFIIKRN